MAGTAIVLGVGESQGLGAALCRRFAREGLHVFLGGRTQSRLEAVAREIESAGGAATVVESDATRAGDVVRLFDAADSPPELVVYNAGNNRFRPLLDMDDAFNLELAQPLYNDSYLRHYPTADLEHSVVAVVCPDPQQYSRPLGSEEAEVVVRLVEARGRPGGRSDGVGARCGCMRDAPRLLV